MGVAQLVERRVVVADAAGSSPVTHPRQRHPTSQGSCSTESTTDKDAAVGTWHAYERTSTSVPATVDSRARAFHESLHDYEATALIDLPALAAELSLGRVVAKDESTRLGLPAFKALGASWAIHRATEGLTGPLTIVTATDGNH